jgi:hypothetical protein
MTDLKLTHEERALAQAITLDRNDRGSRLGFYASVLVPVLLFAGYGIASWNVLAVVFALVGLFIFVGWRISRELAMVSTYRSLCQKIVEHERDANP